MCVGIGFEVGCGAGLVVRLTVGTFEGNFIGMVLGLLLFGCVDGKNVGASVVSDNGSDVG